MTKDESGRKVLIGLLVVGLIVLGDLVSGIIGASSPVLPPGLCSPTNQLCDQIVFDQSVFGNSTSVVEVNTETSNAWTATNGEAMVLVAASNIQGVVTSIVDSVGDIFTQQLILSQSMQHLEIWTAFFKGVTGTSNTVTVNWNASSNNVFVLSAYENVKSFGNTTSTQGTGTTGSVSLETSFSSSWIAGGIGIAPGTPNQQSIVANPGLIRRVDACTITGGGGNCDVEAAIVDNGTGLPADFFESIGASWSATCPLGCLFQIGAIELKGSDLLGPQPLPTNVCTSINGLCVTTQYTINMVGTNTRPNALNQVLTPGTTYCTGVTTTALTTSKTDFVVGWGGWGGISLNTTGLKILVQFYVTTTAPPTTFGSCSPTGTLSGTSTDYFPVSGTLSAGNAFDVSINGCFGGIVCVTQAGAGTYYGYLVITPYIPPGTGTGHINFDQVCNQIYSECWISLQEQK